MRAKVARQVAVVALCVYAAAFAHSLFPAFVHGGEGADHSEQCGFCTLLSSLVLSALCASLVLDARRHFSRPPCYTTPFPRLLQWSSWTERGPPASFS